MEEQQIGWIAAIIIGGIAGWLPEQSMKSQMGLVMNIVLGMAIASWLASLDRACRNPVPAFPQRSPPRLLTAAACGSLESSS